MAVQMDNLRGLQHSKVIYPWGFRRGGKTGKHRKVEVKRKW